MENYNKLEVSEMFQTYENDYNISIKEAENYIRNAKNIASLNPGNREIETMNNKSDEVLRNAQD